MKQPHTEQTIDHTDGEQDTGNHKVPGAPDAGGADRFGGTRAGAENLESDKGGSVESGPDVSRVASLDGTQAGEKSMPDAGLQERSAERDERGRM